MIVFIDNESEKGYESPWGERLMAARVRIKYRLEDLTNQPCLIVRYNKVSTDLLRHYEIQAIFISGSGTDPDQYNPAEQAGMYDALRTKQWPAFGFCGGMQAMSESFGVPIERIGALEMRRGKINPNFAPGYKKEFGYEPVQLLKHPGLEGLGGPGLPPRPLPGSQERAGRLQPLRLDRNHTGATDHPRCAADRWDAVSPRVLDR
ncbi:MAG: hypothetical protein R2932_55520 [Caldilineaceae bacterium]